MTMSKVIGDILESNGKIEKARQVGDTKVGKDGIQRVWTKTPSGYDWRKVKGDGSASSDSDSQKKTAPKSSDSADGKVAKLKGHLKTTSNEDLFKFASRPQNNPTLRKLAYDELVSRGEDVSEIDLNTGKIKEAKELFSAPDASDDSEDGSEIDDVEESDGKDSHEEDWQNEDFIKKKFGGLKTKKQRIAADAYIHQKKIRSADYQTPQQEIMALNKAYAQFFKTDSPLMIASGGAGVGKSFNLHAVAKYMGKKPFDPDVDEPGDGDYDYVEAPEVNGIKQLAQVLQEHNGKIIVFDDSDEVLRKSETMGMLKKATASSGKRIVGKKSANKSEDIPPFEFTGKILFLTNMGQAEFTKNEHMNAIYSRALKKDIQFTKREQLQMIEGLRHKMNFTGLERLPNKADDVQERDEVFQMIKDNIGKIDPGKFNSRTFKEALEIKRSIDSANEMIAEDPEEASILFGDSEDWKPKVENFLVKGILPDVETFEKALEYLELN